MLILASIVICLCIYWAYCVLSTRRMVQMMKSLPALPSFPLIGNAMHFIGNTEKIWKSLEAVGNIADAHKGAAKFWLGQKLYVAISNPVDAQIVLEKCLDKDDAYVYLRAWLGQGLFVAPLNLWKTHRKVLLPVFHNKIVEEYVSTVAEQADVLIERLSEQDQKSEFDVFKYITACTLDVVFETAMGERMDIQHYPDTTYLRARNVVLSILNMRMFKIWLQPDCLFYLTSYAKQQKINIDLTHKFTDDVVKKKRVIYEGHKNNSLEIKPDGKLRAVLDLLFGVDIEFTDIQLREHIDSLTIAGNDTTALVISYTLVLLGIHQDSQEKVLQEQQDIFGNSKHGATKDDLQKMYYLERVIKESMRLYTVVPIIARNIEKDTYLPYCGVTIPKGAGAVVGAFALHRSEAAWGRAAADYDPDRFLPERSADRHPAAFVGFSFGSRNCIGRNFGMLIMKTIISSIIRSYKIEANDIGRLKIEMLLFPINGHQIKIQKR